MIAASTTAPRVNWPSRTWPGVMRRDPWAFYAKSRRECPVAFSPTLGAFCIFSYETVRDALASKTLAAAQPFRSSRRVFGRSILDTDGPEHDRLREIFHEPLRPQRIDVFAREVVKPLVFDMLDDRRSRPTAVRDLVGQIAEPLPMRVLCALTGLPASAEAWLRGEVAVLADQIDHGLRASNEVRDSHNRLERYIEDHLRREDLTGPLGLRLHEQVAAGRLSLSEATSNLVLMLLGGTMTTTCAIANVLCLTLNGGLLSELRSGQAASADVVREALRLEPPVRLTPRFATRPVQIGAVNVPRGATLQLCIASANRDDDAFEQPDSFVLGRQMSGLSFGRGLHSCIGAALGAAEARVVLEAIAEAPGTPRLVRRTSSRPGWTFRRPVSIDVRFGRTQ